MRPILRFAALAGLVLLAACGDGAGPGADPLLASCAGTTESLSLDQGAYRLVDPGLGSGCVAFPANASPDTIEYLVLPQSASATPGAASPFQLRSPTAAAPSLAAVETARPAASAAGRGPIALQFDRSRRRTGAAAAARLSRSPPERRAGGAAVVTPPVLGSLASFQVCGVPDCSSSRTVEARARAVGTHVAIYVDTMAPANGLNPADLDTLQAVIDARLYPIDTTAFGGVSDVDANGVVILLMTGAVNALVTRTQCETGGFVAGYFDSDDIAPPPGTGSNRGEIVYSFVADPAGQLSCPHTRDRVKRDAPVTFVHELQHLINFVQHVVNRRGEAEKDWLDEGLSAIAEELAGNSFLPGDQTTYTSYVYNNLYEAFRYLRAPGSHFLLTIADSDQGDFGAGWLFLRYLVDQHGAGLTRKLVQTSLTGTVNVTTQTGQSWPTLIGRWGLANWVSDLPAFTAPPELTYSSWSFRATFETMHGQDPQRFPLSFPLTPPVSVGADVNLVGTLRAGSGTYLRVLQPPGDGGFRLLLSDGNGQQLPTALAPRVALIRTR
ncbi:MAG: hypothetical protein HY560_08135 [Gemmatimonadetes bacterium]|nr:hypothetical protein [Gemmatimonadota bacterium]